MTLSVSPDYFPAYANLPVRARHAADALLRRLAADPHDASIRREPVPHDSPLRLYQLPVARGYGALAWAPEGGGALILFWVGPLDEAVRRASSRKETALRPGEHPSNGAVPIHEPAAAAPSEPVPAAPGTREPPADVAIDDVHLPTRIHNFADVRGITSLRALAAIGPYDLLNERNLGRTSIAGTRLVIERTFGKRWEELAAEPLPGGAAPAVRAERPWDTLRATLRQGVAALSLDEVGLPPLVRAYAEAEGLRTVADLARRTEAQLLAAPSLDRSAVQATVAAVGAAIPPPRNWRAGLDLLTSWRALLDELSPVDRDVVLRRSGVDGPSETGAAIAGTLGRRPSYAFHREQTAIARLSRPSAWIEDVRARTDAAIGEGGAVTLEVLARDPWWAAAAARPEALAYFGEKMMRGAFHVVRFEERAYMARVEQEALDAAWQGVRRTVEEASFPRLLAALEARAKREARAVGEALSAALWERALGLLVVQTEDDAGRPRAVGLRARNADAALALLRASKEPMRLRDLVARVGRLSPIPAEILHLGPDLVGTPRHFQRFAEWKRRLVPIAIGVMGRRKEGRRWSHADLFAAVREEIDLPSFLDAWHLGALLRHTGRVRDAGFGFLALPGGPAEAKKPQSLHGDVLAIVRDHGEPIPVGELKVQLAETTSFPPVMLSFHLGQPPFVWCDADRVGLVERDLPGGQKARAQAVEHAVTILERRGRGLAQGELQTEIATLSRTHARWTPEMCLSTLHGDLRFRFSTAGGVGLAVWEGARVPSRRDLIRQSLDAGGGRAKVKAIAAQIAKHYGEPLSDDRIAHAAYMLGAVKRGDWIERRAPARK